MPNCFQLVNKSTGTVESFIDIDNSMCAHFGVTLDPKYFYKSWYDIIGFGLATGKSFTEIKDKIPKYKDIIDWLDTNYTAKAWYEPK